MWLVRDSICFDPSDRGSGIDLVPVSVPIRLCFVLVESPTRGAGFASSRGGAVSAVFVRVAVVPGSAPVVTVALWPFVFKVLVALVAFWRGSAGRRDGSFRDDRGRLLRDALEDGQIGAGGDVVFP